MARISLIANKTHAGHMREIAGNRIAVRDDLGLVSVAIPQGGDAALAGTLQHALGLDTPQVPETTSNGDVTAFRLAPDQIMILAPDQDGTAHAKLDDLLGAVAYLTDQSDGSIIVEVQGPDVLAAMERLCPLDLGPSGLRPGHAARTVLEHIGTVVLRTDPDQFLLIAPGSSAASFLHAVETSFEYVTGF